MPIVNAFSKAVVRDFTLQELEDAARLMRGYDLVALCAAGSGHAGGTLSVMEIVAALYLKVATHDPNNPEWPHRDRIVWSGGHKAPALYLGLAVAGLTLVPMAPGRVLVDLPTTAVLWGAIEALTVVAVFLHGWSANAPLPLVGAYRYVAIALPAMLLSMFVLIGAALPAQSLSIAAIVESQRGMWNVLRQPLGLPLFMLLGLALTLRGPFNYADSSDLAGGTAAERSGMPRAVWTFARLSMLVAFAAMACAAFLGGFLGPFLPGFVWMVLKTAAMLLAMVAASHAFARLPPSRMLTLLWLVLLPLAFLDLLIAGVESLR
jgi:NADH-quinone oxidoreductase subunit H